ncbi:MAG: alanine--glyoxylate aminotransferase family protein [Spirochaetales bacterium]|nr:MAG: alanine--glyoxylate aminotransferase family protein [Spirochaetales bacterium]
MLNSVSETLLMGPGPSSVLDSVYKALALPTIGHLDPRFVAIMDEVKEMLRTVFTTTNTLTIPISGTGSAGMETCFVNLVEPGDKVLVLQNGVFGVRMAEVAGRLGADVDVVEFEWGTPVVVGEAVAAIRAKSYKLVAIVHAETSTGVLNPVGELAAEVANSGALYLVDTVTSLGGVPVTVDAWGADAVYSGTQKCLSCPPGLSPVTFSARAQAVLAARTRKVPNWYLDLSLLTSYWEGAKRAYHHTAPINMIYALSQALTDLLDEGIAAVHARHREAHDYLVSELQQMGLDLFVRPECRLPMLNAVTIPAGVDEAMIRGKLLADHAIEIGAGLGPLAGKIWRVGLMGHTARKESVDRLVTALKQLL